MCPTNSKEIKSFVMDKFHKRTWDKEIRRKKKYYIEEFNLTHNHQQGAYIVVKQGVGKGQKKCGKKECVYFTLLEKWK